MIVTAVCVYFYWSWNGRRIRVLISWSRSWTSSRPKITRQEQRKELLHSEQITKLFSQYTSNAASCTCQQYLKKQNAQGGLRPGLDQSERHRDDGATKKRIPNNRFSGAQCNDEMKCKGRRVLTVFKNFVRETLVDHIAAYAYSFCICPLEFQKQ